MCDGQMKVDWVQMQVSRFILKVTVSKIREHLKETVQITQTLDEFNVQS